MGSYLITETVARRHKLSMASYDRLFPNQDTLPNGGSGKTVLGTYLIAERKCNTLVLVHRQPLLEQWRSQIGIFLGRDANQSINQPAVEAAPPPSTATPFGNYPVVILYRIHVGEARYDIIKGLGALSDARHQL